MSNDQVLRCACCGYVTSLVENQARHLREAHAPPAGGFPFYHDGQRYTSLIPSMLVGDVLRMVQGQVMYQFYQEVAGEMCPLAHGNAVDLTNSPHFFSVPPATY